MLEITQRTWLEQRIEGLPQRMVTPPDEVVERIRRENAAIAGVRALDTPGALFAQGWQWPAIGPVSGVYGSRRILNGQPRQPHFGIDVAVPTGTPVIAPTDAVVRMAEPDLYFTGGTVMLDHGHGVTSVYSHLSRIDVTVGQTVKAGEPIGAVGATGRATGAHLDWRINWFGERLDPALFVGPMPAG
ncbi:MAG: M23 family metallopeptidase [Pseudomonadota bacterium]|nr:M23 family metallopeptidase [Pseudomonadota bacterium]